MPYIDKIKIGNVDYDVIGSGEKFPIGTELTIDKAAVIPDGWTEIDEVEVIDSNDFFSSIKSGYTLTKFYVYRIGDVISVQRIEVQGSFNTTEQVIAIVNPDYAPYCATQNTWLRWRGTGNTTFWFGKDAGDTDIVFSAKKDTGTSTGEMTFSMSYIVPARTKKIRKVSPPIMASIDIYATAEKNAGAHNSLYRGKDISVLFYNGTLSTQIAAGTFDNIFIGDYIIGRNSGIKYLVADINYRLDVGTNSVRVSTPHILMIPEPVMGTARMNDTAITTGAYIGSKMYTEYLAPYRTIIIDDFGSNHILTHRNCFQDVVTNGYETDSSWYDSTVDLMSEKMVYGSSIFRNLGHGSNFSDEYTIDNSQLALFRLRHDLIIAKENGTTTRRSYWLRDVSSSGKFCGVHNNGNSYAYDASVENYVRPAFLVY